MSEPYYLGNPDSGQAPTGRSFAERQSQPGPAAWRALNGRQGFAPSPDHSWGSVSGWLGTGTRIVDLDDRARA
jgi:hypothetical protein